MACPTCSHTLSCLADDGDVRYDLCDRCGTVVVLRSKTGVPDVYVPKLVERCREFRRKFKEFHTPVGMQAANLWSTLGIAESINVKEDRL